LRRSLPVARPLNQSHQRGARIFRIAEQPGEGRWCDLTAAPWLGPVRIDAPVMGELPTDVMSFYTRGELSRRARAVKSVLTR
jgi:hypothetical protein